VKACALSSTTRCRIPIRPSRGTIDAGHAIHVQAPQKWRRACWRFRPNESLKLELTLMSRLEFPDRDALSAAARQVYDATASGRRGRVPKNVMVWLRSPELADRAQRLGEFVRYETTLGRRRSELAILVVARRWTAQYEWAIHAAEAARAGVPLAIIADIAERRTPEFEDEVDQIIFDFSTALVTSSSVPDEVYRKTVGRLGEQATVELVAVIGYYTFVAMTLNAFEIEPPPGANVLRAP
jgi:4-carboxymuconolactone decarboxylase